MDAETDPDEIHYKGPVWYSEAKTSVYMLYHLSPESPWTKKCKMKVLHSAEEMSQQ